ncbi:MAG: hypothetical protein IBX44_00830 [Sulfurospirillum sp.]|nr:hypothetical protein [Sulfurospirillum sp.]
MKQMILLFSHTLTNSQEIDAIYNLGVGEFIYLPLELQKLWSEVSPQSDDVTAYLQPIKDFILKSAKQEDYILIQGDFGCTVEMVDFCKKNELIPLYSTNKRDSKECFLEDGNRVIKKSSFEHIRYRLY